MFRVKKNNIEWDAIQAYGVKLRDYFKSKYN